MVVCIAIMFFDEVITCVLHRMLLRDGSVKKVLGAGNGIPTRIKGAAALDHSSVNIVIIGGSSKIPKIKTILKEKFGAKK